MGRGSIEARDPLRSVATPQGPHPLTLPRFEHVGVIPLAETALNVEGEYVDRAGRRRLRRGSVTATPWGTYVQVGMTGCTPDVPTCSTFECVHRLLLEAIAREADPIVTSVLKSKQEKWRALRHTTQYWDLVVVERTHLYPYATSERPWRICRVSDDIYAMRELQQGRSHVVRGGRCRSHPRGCFAEVLVRVPDAGDLEPVLRESALEKAVRKIVFGDAIELIPGTVYPRLALRYHDGPGPRRAGRATLGIHTGSGVADVEALGSIALTRPRRVVGRPPIGLRAALDVIARTSP